METIKAFIRRTRVTARQGMHGFLIDGEVARARALFRSVSEEVGGGANPYLLTKQESSAKLVHNAEFTSDYWQVVLYLLPHNLSGVLHVCPWSTKGCRASCLSTAGRLGMPAGHRAKLARTLFLARHPYEFMVLLNSEIQRYAVQCTAGDKHLVVRLNGTSDIPWELFVPELFHYWDVDGVTFQDYTKDGTGKVPSATRDGSWPLPNYYLVRSAHEKTPDWLLREATVNMVVAVNVKRGAPLPSKWMGKRVVDGDKHDLRLLDPQDGRIVMVRAKGDGIGDESGFIRNV